MKKALYGTTAIIAGAAALTIAGTAKAADPIQLGISGDYLVSWGAAFDDATTPERNTFSGGANWEVHFNGSTTLDNGITVGAGFQFETPGDGYRALQADEAHVFVSGGFGRLNIGTVDSAIEEGSVVPTNGAAVYGVEEAQFTHLSAGGAVTVSTDGATTDAFKLQYRTPRLAGFRLMASYAPGGQRFVSGSGTAGAQLTSGETSSDGVGPTSFDTNYNDEMTVSLNYQGSFSGVSVEVGGGFGYADAPGGTQQASQVIPGSSSVPIEDWVAFNAGAEIGVAGFTIGGAYAKEYNNGGTAETDSRSWLVGTSYTTGPVMVALGYGNDVSDAARTTAGQRRSLDSVATTEQSFLLSGGYDLGPGVTVGVALRYVSSNVGLGADQDGFSLATGLGVSF